jgi:hypothetical protein
MPFITLNTDSSNLAKYYNFVNNGVFSNPPAYNNVTNTQKPTYPTDRYTFFDDGLIRGGATNTGLAIIQDTKRISEFLLSPKGISFVTKQEVLSRTGPQLEKPYSSLININPTRIYNPLNTLAQVGINAVGGHLRKQGLLPISGVGYLDGNSLGIAGYTYEKVTTKNNKLQDDGYITLEEQINDGLDQYRKDNQIEDDTFIELNPTTIGFDPTIKNYRNNFGKQPSNNPNRLVRLLSKLSTYGSKDGVNTMFSYNGGAGSVYGIGKTYISTTNVRTGLSPTAGYDNTQKNTLINEYEAQKYEAKNKLSDIHLNLGVSSLYADVQVTKDGGIIGYDTPEAEKAGAITVKNHWIDSINFINIIPNAVFYGNSGEFALRNNNTTPISSGEANSTTFNFSNIGGDDNKIKPYDLQDDKEKSWAVQPLGDEFGRDLIKFRIEFISNEYTNQNWSVEYDDPAIKSDVSKYINTDILAFRAYIDDFQDGMSSKWDSYRYMGRGEEFYVYNGFTRDISVAFTMHAHSEYEMAPLYNKLNYLMSTFTPDYTSQNKMRGNIAMLTVGDYIYRQPGIFTDIKLSGFLEGSWETGRNDNGTSNGQYELPRMLKVGLSFKPIHTFLPRRNYAFKNDVSKFPAAFITPDKRAYPKPFDKDSKLGTTDNAYLNTGGWKPEPKNP